jgi:superfamily II DNA or RNA helicase
MNLTHEFKSRGVNEEFDMSPNSYASYMEVIESRMSTVSSAYPNTQEYRKQAFGILVEGIVKDNTKKFGVYGLSYQHNGNVTFVGKNKNGDNVAILALYVKDDREVKMNADNLSSFVNTAMLSHNVDQKAKDRMYVFTNSKKVHESIQKIPTLKDKVTFICLDEIEGLLNDNEDFWDRFNTALFYNVVRKTPKAFILRDFQIGAVEQMERNIIGQILMPTGTGKTVIEAEYVKRMIEKMLGGFCIIVLLCPRIILTAQLMRMVNAHLISSKKDVQYVNLSSGDVSESSVEMYNFMKDAGLDVRVVTATTSIYEVKKVIEDARKANVPVIISGTYHSGWKLKDLGEPVDVLLCDEAHNLIMGRFSEDAKEECLNIEAKNRFFFTATPCNSSSNSGRGMNNSSIFGEIIYRKSYREMLDRCEIAPIRIQTVRISDCVLKKNKALGISEDNLKDPDFDRDITGKAKAIYDSFAFHSAEIKRVSAHPENIEAKLLVTVDGFVTLNGLCQHDWIKKLFTENGVIVMAISTDGKYFKNGITYDSYDFKEQFQKDMCELKDEDRAVILHIDMIGEGLDVAGITGLMAFSTQGRLKLMQLLGRGMRLHNSDRKRLYKGDFYKGMCRESMMIKPYVYVIIPMFVRESNDLYELVRWHVHEIHTNFDFKPEVIENGSNPIGDNEVYSNEDFKAKADVYEKLDFKHEIEMENFRYLMSVGAYEPDVNLTGNPVRKIQSF